jgi:glycerol-3-phosphate acyltransferase PlsY
MLNVLIVLGSYLFGGIPVAYLTGRALGGVDIRERGSGNVGASNVWQTVSRAAVVPVGLAEIAQGALPVLVADALGAGRGVQVLAGLAAVAGHNWSPFLRFAGGRGIAHAIGFMAVLSRPALAAFTVVSLVGVAVRAVPQLVGLGIVAAPLAALAARQPAETVAGLGGVAGLIALKRALANERAVPAWDVLRNRLLYDRDTREREAWVQRDSTQS